MNSFKKKPCFNLNSSDILQESTKSSISDLFLTSRGPTTSLAGSVAGKWAVHHMNFTNYPIPNSHFYFIFEFQASRAATASAVCHPCDVLSPAGRQALNAILLRYKSNSKLMDYVSNWDGRKFTLSTVSYPNITPGYVTLNPKPSQTQMKHTWTCRSSDHK